MGNHSPPSPPRRAESWRWERGRRGERENGDVVTGDVERLAERIAPPGCVPTVSRAIRPTGSTTCLVKVKVTESPPSRAIRVRYAVVPAEGKRWMVGIPEPPSLWAYSVFPLPRTPCAVPAHSSIPVAPIGQLDIRTSSPDSNASVVSR